jgi:hypothetical protein
MDNALITVRVVGLANVIKIIDIIVKNTYVEIEKVLPDMGGGALNIILRGTIGQIKEAEMLIGDFFTSKKIEYQASVITNFDFSIVNKDDKEFQFNKTKL